MSAIPVKESPAVDMAQKERSMVLQKQMIANHYEELATAHDSGKKVVYTFVPGNLTELIGSFDLLPVLPEINALQSGRSEEHTSELQSLRHLVCRLLLEKKQN